MAFAHRSWSEVRAHLASVGLNAVGVADGGPWQAWLPGCRSVVVVGSGGPALWHAFRRAVEEEPTRFTEDRDPLDTFVRRAVAAADPGGPGRRWVFADVREPPYAPIQELALAAGLGWRSRLWILMHPTFGPWFGLRAACFTTEVLPVDGRRADASPCEGCPAPCRSACPGDALRGGQLDSRWCFVHRAATRDCLDVCHARAACPVGAVHRYPAEAHVFHHDKPRGRAALAAALGVEDHASPPAVDWRARARWAWERLRGDGTPKG